MGKRYSETVEVPFYHCDVNGHLTLPAMLGMVIKTSEAQSDALDRGKEFVANFGLTWVITNYEMTIKRLPEVGEQITITTEAISYNKYFCYRNFWIHDASGAECVLIESTFVLMDLVNRKMSSVLEEIIAPYESKKIKKIHRGEKILPVAAGTFLPYRVRYYDIDSNQHVNNAMYFNWLIDVLGFDFLTKHQPKEIHIKFEKEVEYGHEIESWYEVDQEALTSHHEIRIEDQIYCSANILWS